MGLHQFIAYQVSDPFFQDVAFFFLVWLHMQKHNHILSQGGQTLNEGGRNLIQAGHILSQDGTGPDRESRWSDIEPRRPDLEPNRPGLKSTSKIWTLNQDHEDLNKIQHVIRIFGRSCMNWRQDPTKFHHVLRVLGGSWRFWRQDPNYRMYYTNTAKHKLLKRLWDLAWWHHVQAASPTARCTRLNVFEE